MKDLRNLICKYTVSSNSIDLSYYNVFYFEELLDQIDPEVLRLDGKQLTTLLEIYKNHITVGRYVKTKSENILLHIPGFYVGEIDLTKDLITGESNLIDNPIACLVLFHFIVIPSINSDMELNLGNLAREFQFYLNYVVSNTEGLYLFNKNGKKCDDFRIKKIKSLEINNKISYVYSLSESTLFFSCSLINETTNKTRTMDLYFLGRPSECCKIKIALDLDMLNGFRNDLFNIQISRYRDKLRALEQRRKILTKEIEKVELEYSEKLDNFFEFKLEMRKELGILKKQDNGDTNTEDL